MTTPRIEETRKRILDEMNSRRIKGKTYIDSDWLLSEYEKELTTQAHQAGIDEAVEVVKDNKKDARQIRDMYFKNVVGEPIPNEDWADIINWKDAYNQALDDTIKALQDNK